MSQLIKVKDYFKGIEGLYDDCMSTQFSITDSYDGIYTNAQFVFLQRRVDLWKREIVNLGLNLLSFSFDPTGDNTFLFKAELVAHGGIKIDYELYTGVREVLSSFIRKNLALDVLKNNPLLLVEKNQIGPSHARREEKEKYFASGVKLHWTFNPERNDIKEDSLFTIPRAKKIFTDRDIRVVSISFKNKVNLGIILEKDMKGTYLERLLTELSFKLNEEIPISFPKIVYDLE